MYGAEKEKDFEVGPFIAFMLGHDFHEDLMASDGSIESLNEMLAKVESFGLTRPWPEWVNPSQFPEIDPVDFKKAVIWALNDYCGFDLPYSLAEQPEPEGRQLEL